jgi:hypothetical protein
VEKKTGTRARTRKKKKKEKEIKKTRTNDYESQRREGTITNGEIHSDCDISLIFLSASCF